MYGKDELFKYRVAGMKGKSVGDLRQEFELLLDRDREFCEKFSQNRPTYDTCFTTSQQKNFGLFLVKDQKVIHAEFFGT